MKDLDTRTAALAGRPATGGPARPCRCAVRTAAAGRTPTPREGWL
ncbi:hypothetical protein [Streptomyces sp. BV286]|nr:hypothetical protein [Streptomyces sp. BV286]